MPVVVVVFLLSPASAQVATITFTIDPARSQLVGSGNVRNIPLTPQKPGSLMGSLGGTLRAQWRENGLTFVGGSMIVAAPHPEGPFVPSAAAVGSGSMVDNFGGEGRVFGFRVLSAAVRDAVAEIVSGRSDYGGPVTDLRFAFVDGTVDYHDEFNDQLGWIDLTKRDPVFNSSTANLTRTVQNNLDTITLPIFVDLQFAVLAPNDSRLRLQGQLVGTSPVLTIERNSLATINSAQHLAALNIEPGATVKLTGGTLVTQALNLAGGAVSNSTPDLSGAIAVPEPPGWLLMSLVALTAAMWRRRSSPRTAKRTAN